MDHNAFLKMALEHSIVGQRVLYEVAESPQLVMSLNKDEGLILLERALKTYGHLVSWSGMGYVSEHWPINRLQEMILRLVEEPEVAGGFLGNEWAHAVAGGSSRAPPTSSPSSPRPRLSPRSRPGRIASGSPPGWANS